MGLRGRIQFTGGEPLLSGDLFVLLEEARKRKMPARLLSNGTLLTRDIARELKEAGCKTVQISLDGDRETHNAIRGEFASEKAIEGARQSKEEGISITVMMTVSGTNHTQLNQVYKEVVSASAHRFSFSRLVPIGRGASYSGEMLSANQMKGLFQSCLALKSENLIEMPMRDPLWGPYLSGRANPPNPRLLSGCSIGYNGICIDSDGSVYPCRRLPVLLGNVMNDDLEKIWNCETLERLRNRDALRGKCGKCRYRWQCGGCRAVAYAMSGDSLAEDPQCFI
ncbi:MAG: radical SAM protein [Nitrospirae bacterium]|nr:radical SAM protein [Nitrospirota bacterium]